MCLYPSDNFRGGRIDNKTQVIFNDIYILKNFMNKTFVSQLQMDDGVKL